MKKYLKIMNDTEQFQSRFKKQVPFINMFILDLSNL